jgi:hypothetical protein
MIAILILSKFINLLNLKAYPKVYVFQIKIVRYKLLQ